jgi:Zn-finger nucleic acid-binding protein
VLAHELAHVSNRDTLVMTVAATLAGAVSMLANLGQWVLLLGSGRGAEDGDEGPSPAFGLLGVLVAPFAAMLVQMAISRSREFLADEAGARLTRDPRALASALRKIEAWSQQVSLSAGTPATAHLFIVNPFAGGGLLPSSACIPRPTRGPPACSPWSARGWRWRVDQAVDAERGRSRAHRGRGDRHPRADRPRLRAGPRRHRRAWTPSWPEPRADPALVRVEREGETIVKCPTCGMLLNEVTKAGVLIDVCDRCLGIWLERGELEKITARLRQLEQDMNDDIRRPPAREPA